jgi:hypothetical protein
MTLQLPPRWRPHTELPDTDEVFTVVIAHQQSDGGLLLLDNIYHWRNGAMCAENNDARRPPQPYWWLPENDLLALIEVIAL